MIITAEISLYPLNSNYEDTIINFIKGIKSYPTIEVYTNAMSTQITGDWSEVMRALELELGKVYEQIETSSTVIKIINSKLPIEKGHLNF